MIHYSDYETMPAESILYFLPDASYNRIRLTWRNIVKDFQLRNDTRLLICSDPAAALEDLDARGVILYGASISTSGRLGLGKEENYSYDIYELEFIPEVLFDVSYRKSLTTLFPRFLEVMAEYHEEDIRRYFNDAFGYEGSIADSVDRMIGLFSAWALICTLTVKL